MQDPQEKLQIKIEQLDIQKSSDFWQLIENMGFSKDRDYFDHAIERQIQDEVRIIQAFSGSRLAGYCFFNKFPKYTFFKLHNIPEIQDLNVLREFRNRGIGRALIEHCESIAVKLKYSNIGIGVGLDSSFGSAQRLYVKMGYIPDGNGISYDRKQVITGEFRPIDENLCLMMTKNLLN